MDSITALALSVDNPLVHMAGMILDDTIIYVVIVMGLLLIGENRNDKRMKIIASLVVAALAVIAIKHTLQIERPCIGEDWCPDDYSFPSTHAAVGFALMAGFLNKRSYALYLLFALFVGFTRMNIGVHVFGDIAGALPIALIAYYVTDIFWRERHGS